MDPNQPLGSFHRLQKVSADRARGTLTAAIIQTARQPAGHSQAKRKSSGEEPASSPRAPAARTACANWVNRRGAGGGTGSSAVSMATAVLTQLLPPHLMLQQRGGVLYCQLKDALECDRLTFTRCEQLHEGDCPISVS